MARPSVPALHPSTQGHTVAETDRLDGDMSDLNEPGCADRYRQELNMSLFDSMPDRLALVEREMHTAKHMLQAMDGERVPVRLGSVEQRLEVLEAERLPHRVGSMETSVIQMRSDVIKIERTGEEIKKSNDGLEKALLGFQIEIKSSLRTALWIGSGMLILVTALPPIIGMFK